MHINVQTLLCFSKLHVVGRGLPRQSAAMCIQMGSHDLPPHGYWTESRCEPACFITMLACEFNEQAKNNDTGQYIIGTSQEI